MRKQYVFKCSIRNPSYVHALPFDTRQIGKTLFAVSPLKDISIPVEVVSSHYVDPNGERVRS